MSILENLAHFGGALFLIVVGIGLVLCCLIDPDSDNA